MFYNLLANASKTRSVSIGEASLYALLGFAVVLVGITFLIFVVWFVGKIMAKNKGQTEQAIKVKEKKEEKIQSLAVADATEEISEEIIAVITAALMAYYQKNNPKCEFTVKRIKRI